MAEAPAPQTPAPKRRHGFVRLFVWMTLSLLTVAALVSFTVAWKSMLERRRHVANPPTEAPTEWPTSTATPTPTQTPTPSATPTTSPPQWSATWQGATGLLLGRVTVTNPGPGPITIQGWPRLQIVDSQGKVLAVTLAAQPLADGAAVSPVTLAAGEKAALTFTWQNWCAGAASGPLTVRVLVNNVRADIPVRGPDGQPQGDTPRCDAPAAEAVLRVSPFAPAAAQTAAMPAAAWVQLDARGAVGEYGAWPISAAQAGELTALLKGLAKVDRPFAPGQGQGYHGLSLTAYGDAAGLPASLRVDAGLVETQGGGQTAVYVDAGGKLEQWLLATGRPYLTADYYAMLQQAIVRSVATPVPGIGLAALRMVDAKNGWALGQAGSVLRTQDGGAHWANVTPKDVAMPALQTGGDSSLLSTCFVDAQAALVAVRSAGGAWTVLRTADGGANWQRASLPLQAPSLSLQLAFADRQQGWAMASLGVGLGSNPVSIYSTADGGATWTLAASGDPAKAPAAGALPSTGLKTGIARRDANTGWVTGLTYAAGEAYLYATSDGGKTWNQQKVPIPADYREAQVTTLPPLWWGDKDGVLPARLALTTLVVFCSTHDGGASWQPGPLLTLPGPANLLYAWASAQLGWCTAGPAAAGAAPLFRTTDGGQTWQALHPAQDLAGAVQLAFVDAQHGWALLANDGRFSGMLRTDDGGATWKPLVPEPA